MYIYLFGQAPVVFLKKGYGQMWRGEGGGGIYRNIGMGTLLAKGHRRGRGHRRGMGQTAIINQFSNNLCEEY